MKFLISASALLLFLMISELCTFFAGQDVEKWYILKQAFCSGVIALVCWYAFSKKSDHPGARIILIILCSFAVSDVVDRIILNITERDINDLLIPFFTLIPLAWKKYRSSKKD